MPRLPLVWTLLAMVASATTSMQHHKHHRVRSAEAPAMQLPFSREQQALQREKEQIFQSVQHVSDRMDAGAGLHRELDKAKVKVNRDEHLINRLRRESASVRESHHVAAKKLKEVMLPRIANSERRLQRKHALVVKKQHEVEKWDAVRSKAKARALHAEEEKASVGKRLAEARAEVQRAVKQEEWVRKNYQMVESQVAQDVQGLKFTDAKLLASKTEVARELEEEQTLEAGVNKAKAQLASEQFRFDKELASTEDRLEKHINHAELQKEKAESEFFVIKDKFLAWQAEQKEKANEVAAMKRDYEARQIELQKEWDEMKGKMDAQQTQISLDGFDDAEDWAWSH